MIHITDLIKDYPTAILSNRQPWEITASMAVILHGLMPSLGDDYVIKDDIAIHRTAIVERGVTLKAPVIIGAKCFIGAHAYLRGGVYLGSSVSIGPGSEIKTSIILSHSATAHFNFIGDSIIGSHVNFEAGAIIANHYNEREDKTISVYYDGETVVINPVKFGAVVGDHSKVGANAVLSPGTILRANSVVGRLELVQQGGKD